MFWISTVTISPLAQPFPHTHPLARIVQSCSLSGTRLSCLFMSTSRISGLSSGITTGFGPSYALVNGARAKLVHPLSLSRNWYRLLSNHCPQTSYSTLLMLTHYCYSLAPSIIKNIKNEVEIQWVDPCVWSTFYWPLIVIRSTAWNGPWHWIVPQHSWRLAWFLKQCASNPWPHSHQQAWLL